GGRLAVCSGNIVRNLSPQAESDDHRGRGIGIGVEADTVLANNVVEGAPRAGIWLGWGEALRDVSATGNVVRDAQIGIAVSVAPGAGKALISDNLISRSRAGAIVGMKWLETATGDLAREGAAQIPGIAVERNHVS
ncbi:MAG TPA: TIGR03808 family TAT-translocated repetitive protein, partial [Hyphomicrobiales bacterium]|nr:TIGR03808 family TAT-translocated repetitive protein [Hyphomicrobiales bacterium]